MRSLIVATALAGLFSAGARADEQPVPLIDGAGRELVENNCAACHSLDYLRINAKFLDRKTWQAEIDKMSKMFGAEIAPQDSAAIVDYLLKNYGSGG